MENELIEIEPQSQVMPVTQRDLEVMNQRLDTLNKFITTRMVKNTDFGTIPGTKKDTLFQPGAQKLARLFGYTCEKKCVHRELDHEAGFASYTYQATVYRNGRIVAQTEGECNSKEKKYASRPLYDVNNTLIKMAQKRAFVGAVIEATGASDFFTQDIDDPEDARKLGLRQVSPVAKTPQPKATKSYSHDQTQDAEICQCGNQMMVSRYAPFDWYCGKCKSHRERAQ